ncbi:MAG: hypothetical protein V9E94_03020 [Microthrixaceae bacterium]
MYVALCNRIVGPDEPGSEQLPEPGSTPIVVTAVAVGHVAVTAEETR